MHGVERGLITRIGMDGGHEALQNANRFMQHHGDGRQAVGGAGSIRHHSMRRRELVMVDAIHHGQVRIGGGRGNQHALGAGGKMFCGIVTAGEKAGAFHRNVDVEFFPGQFGRVAFRRHPDRACAAINAVFGRGDSAGKTSVYGIKAQQMRIGFHRPKIVHRDNLDVLAAGFNDPAQNVAANTSKSVNRYAQRHVLFSLLCEQAARFLRYRLRC